MASELSIGLSGIQVAQKALQTIGHNIANANTEGYSRQEVSLTSLEPTMTTIGPIGQGVKISEITRFKDDMLDSQIRSNTSLLGNAEIKSKLLQNLEFFLNELADSGVSIAIESFFASVQQLSTSPELVSNRNQVLQEGLNLSNVFNLLDDQLKQLQLNTGQQIVAKVSELNSFASEIASLNGAIAAIETGSQGNANDARDKRDALVVRLSSLADLRVIENSNGTINVNVGGSIVVNGTDAEEISTFPTGARTVGIAVSSLDGGELKGLLDIQDVTIPKYQGYLDSLASAIISEVNNIHSEGVGLEGSFYSLSSTNEVKDSSLELSSSISSTGLPFASLAGNLYVTVIDSSTGVVTKSNLTIASSETLDSLATQLDLINGIDASVTSGILSIASSTSDYTFNFSKQLDPNPGDIGTSTASLSGYYTGSDNDTYTLTATDAGTIGSGSTKITVTDSGGATITVLDVGSSYTVGDKLLIADGVYVSLGSGTIVAQTLTFDVTEDPDTSNVLAALGINTFFEGNDAGSFGVAQYIESDVTKIAAASSDSVGDNTNVLRIANLQNKLTMSSSTATFSGFLESTTSEIGLETKQAISERKSFDSLQLSLENSRQAISGVSIDEEMINIIRFQQAFQASAKFISIMDELNTILMGIKR